MSVRHQSAYSMRIFTTRCSQRLRRLLSLVIPHLKASRPVPIQPLSENTDIDTKYNQREKKLAKHVLISPAKIHNWHYY